VHAQNQSIFGPVANIFGTPCHYLNVLQSTNTTIYSNKNDITNLVSELTPAHDSPIMPPVSLNAFEVLLVLQDAV